MCGRGSTNMVAASSAFGATVFTTWTIQMGGSIERVAVQRPSRSFRRARCMRISSCRPKVIGSSAWRSARVRAVSPRIEFSRFGSIQRDGRRVDLGRLPRGTTSTHLFVVHQRETNSRFSHGIIRICRGTGPFSKGLHGDRRAHGGRSGRARVGGVNLFFNPALRRTADSLLFRIDRVGGT